MTEITSSADGKRVWGAVYVPAKAYNAYQAWEDYSSDETERDFGYAQSIRLNALRIWLSYEYWLEQPEELTRKYSDMLSLAAKRGIRIMPSLFECCGVDSTPEALGDRNPLTAFCVHSPSHAIVKDHGQWGKPFEYVAWFMSTFKDDRRQLAIELINEPHEAEMPFTFALFDFAKPLKGMVPLTFAPNVIFERDVYDRLALDVFNIHNRMNFVPSEETAHTNIRAALQTGKTLGLEDIWITEWQRLRPGGWNEISGDEWQPNYSSLCRIVQSYPVGAFFWSLMLKPAYLPSQRKLAVINGVFHEDGAVWSLEDARAISGDASFKAEERKIWPEWAQVIPDLYNKEEA
jgi:hypothetical protein